MTENFVPGLTQSQTLTRAAQKLSEARKRVEKSQTHLTVDTDRLRIHDALENAELAYKAAYKAYTNPFGVEKTYQPVPNPAARRNHEFDRLDEYTEEDVHVS